MHRMERGCERVSGVLESMRTPAAFGGSTARVQKIPIKREKHDVDVFDWTTLV